MTTHEFVPQFERMERAFRPVDTDVRASVFADWFGQLQHYAIEAVEHGISDVIASKRDTFWPAIGEVRGRIQDRLRGLPKTPGKCDTCHGSGWVEAGPVKANGGLIYETVRRCSDCGIPAPQQTTQAHQEPLSGTEYQAYLAARSGAA